MVQDKLRLTFGDYLGKGEVAIYSILALLLSITALTAIATAGKQLWDSVSHWTMATPPETLRCWISYWLCSCWWRFCTRCASPSVRIIWSRSEERRVGKE